MKESTDKRRRAWFWVGVILLSISALWWLLIIAIAVDEPEEAAETIGVGLLLSAVPIGVGIYWVRRGRKALVVGVQQNLETTSELGERKVETKMVIGHTTGERIGAIFGLAFVVIVIIIIAAQFFPVILASVVGILIGLFILRAVLSGNIVIDKSTTTITISKYSLFLTNRSRVIPFSEVRNVRIDYRPLTYVSEYGRSSRDAWDVSLNIGEKVEIKTTTKKAKMLQLASDISKFISTELVDNSAKPESSTGLFRKVKGFFGRGSS